MTDGDLKFTQYGDICKSALQKKKKTVWSSKRISADYHEYKHLPPKTMLVLFV